MKSRRRTFLLILCGCLPGIAAGFGGGWLAARKTVPSGNPSPAAAVKAAGPGIAGLPGSSSAGTSAKTGSPEAAAALLTSLKNGRGIQAHIAVLQHVSGMSLEELKAEAKKAETEGYSMDPNEGMLRQAVFTRWAELDSAGLVEAGRRSGESVFGYLAMAAGFGELAKQNPDSAWELASGQRMGVFKNQAQQAVVQEIARTNPEKAFSLALKNSGTQGGWMMQSIMGSWVDRDPAAAAAAVQSLKGDRRQRDAVSSLMQRWAAKDYETAAAWASGLDPSQRGAALAVGLQTLAQSDPEKALKLLDSTDTGNARSEVMNKAMSMLALQDFGSALERANSFKSFRDKTAALSALAGVATDAEKEQLLKLAANLPANISRSIYQSNMWQQAWNDPAALLKTVEAIPHAAVREQAMIQATRNMAYYSPEEGGILFSKMQPSSQNPGTAQSIASGMASADPEKALKWAEGLGTEALKKSALAGALQQWAGTDPEAAGKQIAKITNPETRAEVTRSVAQGLAGRSLGEAEKWASGLNGSDRSAALSVVAQRAANDDPERAQGLYQKFAASLSPEDAAKSENQAVARAVSSQMAQTDAAKAVAWTMALPEGGARDEAVSGVVSTWASWDAVAASEWVSTLEQGKGRDLAAGNLVKTIARDDPESAWTWAGSIADAARRREAAAAALDGWKANGQKDAARAALESGNFTDTERQELTRRLE